MTNCDNATELLLQARVEADGQRRRACKAEAAVLELEEELERAGYVTRRAVERAAKAEAELAETKAVWLDAETRAQRVEADLAAARAALRDAYTLRPSDGNLSWAEKHAPSIEAARAENGGE